MISPWLRTFIVLLVVTAVSVAEASKLRYIMYLTGQHNVVPESALVMDVTHVALAFMRSEIFNNPGQSVWPLFTNIQDVRHKFASKTLVQVAIGGWGDTDGFSRAAKTEKSRKLFAENVKAMLNATGADGVDMDWEYPGGNGEDYKTHPNSEKAWEVDAFPKLLAEIRAAIGPEKIISAAVPGLPRDMIAFTSSTIPKIMPYVDFFNVMTYDLINRRDNVTKHHTGVNASWLALNTYLERGVPHEKMNLGLAFYVKWFKTAPDGDCHMNAIGCATELMEDPKTGADLGKAGAFSWHNNVPPELAKSFDKAMKNIKHDQQGGGSYYWDEKERMFWSWDTRSDIIHKLESSGGSKRLGGAFAWGLGEDAPDFQHLMAANEGMRRLAARERYRERTEL